MWSSVRADEWWYCLQCQRTRQISSAARRRSVSATSWVLPLPQPLPPPRRGDSCTCRRHPCRPSTDIVTVLCSRPSSPISTITSSSSSGSLCGLRRRRFRIRRRRQPLQLGWLKVRCTLHRAPVVMIWRCLIIGAAR